MSKIIFGGIVGGIILFLWSVLAWVILPLHEPHLRKMANEDVVISALQSAASEKGVYLIPHQPSNNSDQATMDAWSQKVKQGPVVMIVYDPRGMDPMMAGQMMIGLLLDIISGCIIAWFLSRSTAAASPYLARVAYCGMIGVFVSFFTHLMNWNWMGFPSDYTTGLIIDGIVGCLLAGLGIGAFIKPLKQNAA